MIRTDYSNQPAWEELRRRIETPNSDGFRAYVAYYDAESLDGRGLTELLALVENGPFRTFFFVVDNETILHPDHPVLVVGAREQHGRTFRVMPNEMWSVENNLSLSNMDFEEFADNVDPDGVFRGFR